MALTAVEQKHLATRERERGIRTYTRVWYVTSDTTTATLTEVSYATGVPREGEVHNEDLSARARRISVSKRDGSDQVFEVSVSYSSDPNEQQDEENPLSQPAKRSFFSISREAPVERAYEFLNGQEGYPDEMGPLDELLPTENVPILNSAGDPFTSPVIKQISDFGLRITRNEANISAPNIVSYMNTVNSTSFFGAPPGQALMFDISVNQVDIDQVTSYFEVTYEIHFREETFHAAVVDRGFRMAVDFGGEEGIKHFKATDEDGLPVTEPVLLDGAGLVLTDNTQAESYEPHFRWYRIYKARDFNALNLI